MTFFIVELVSSGERGLYQANRKIVKGDFVVVANYDDEPVTAKVVEMVSRLKAIKMNREPEEIISYIDMKSFNAKREKELDDIILIDKMETEIKRIQMMEKLEKYAGKDPKMLELLNIMNGQNALDEETETETEY